MTPTKAQLRAAEALMDREKRQVVTDHKKFSKTRAETLRTVLATLQLLVGLATLLVVLTR